MKGVTDEMWRYERLVSLSPRDVVLARRRVAAYCATRPGVDEGVLLAMLGLDGDVVEVAS